MARQSPPPLRNYWLTNVNIFDVILLIPLVIGAIGGFKTGLIREIFSILAFVLGLIAGFKLLHMGMDWLRDTFDLHGDWLPLIAFLMIFVVVVILTNAVGKLLQKVAGMTFLGIFDKIGGAVIAVFKWALGVSVVLWLLNNFSIDLPQSWTEDSLIYPYLMPMTEVVTEYIGKVLPFASDLFESIRSLAIG